MHCRTVSAIAVIDLANELAERGVIDNACVADFGHEYQSLFSRWKNGTPIQEQRLPEQQLLTLWKLADEASETIGFEVGNKVNIEAKGLLANWLSHSTTLAEAFDIFRENIALLNPSEQWSMESEEGRGLKLAVTFQSPEYPNIAAERSLAAILAWSEQLSGIAISPGRITLKRRKPLSKSPFKAHLSNVVEYAQTENAVWVPINTFERKVSSANAYIASLLENQARTLSTLCELDNKRGIVRQVERLLSLNLPKYCTLSETCEALHLSRSSLYRKLKIENNSFTEMVKNARIQHVNNNANTLTNTQDLSEQLGFKDLGSYYRFLKKQRLQEGFLSSD